MMRPWIRPPRRSFIDSITFRANPASSSGAELPQPYSHHIPSSVESRRRRNDLPILQRNDARRGVFFIYAKCVIHFATQRSARFKGIDVETFSSIFGWKIALVPQFGDDHQLAL